MDWKERALALLKDSLEPVPSELNEIDWKSGLSDKSDRLAQQFLHLPTICTAEYWYMG